MVPIPCPNAQPQSVSGDDGSRAECVTPPQTPLELVQTNSAHDEDRVRSTTHTREAIRAPPAHNGPTLSLRRRYSTIPESRSEPEWPCSPSPYALPHPPA